MRQNTTLLEKIGPFRPNRTALAVILTLSLVLAACGGSAGEDEPSSETPAPAVSATPQPTPTPSQTAPDTPQPAPTPAGNASGEAASDDPIDIVEHLREKTMRMWDAYNTHDPDALEVFYEENYWQKEKEELRANMQPFKSRGMTFTAEETSPPTEIAPGKWKTLHAASYAGGVVNMVFIYEQFGGDWLLTYAEVE